MGTIIALYLHLRFVVLRIRLGIFFYKRPDSKYFGLHVLCLNYSTLLLHEGSHRQESINEGVWQYSNQTLFMKTEDVPDLAHGL